MTARILRFYLDPSLRQSAAEGRHNFIAKIAQVVEQAGFRVEYCANSETERMKSAGRNGYAMFHMDDPFHDRALTIRRAYYYPFWQIERSAKRWDWRVATEVFDPAHIPAKEAARFAGFWRKRLFDTAADAPTQDGFVYVPLQGKLLDHRSFQTCSPLQMIETVLAQTGPHRVIATLHPNESYSDAEQSALQDLEAKHDRLTLQMGGMERLLAGCDFIVTQNSAVSFAGLFFGKPSILFAQVDFHHICASVPHTGIDAAFARIAGHAPNYDAYLWWFLQQMSINAGRPEAESKIRAELQRHGWPV